MVEKTVNYETGEILATTDPKAQASLFAKLARATGKLKKVPKTGYNTHFKYDFVTDGDVSDAIRPVLANEGVAFFASMQSARADGKKTTVDMVYTFADGETGATWSCNWTGEAIDSQDKGIAKAATSALKYFLLKTFVLSAGDPGDDSDNGKPEKTPSGQPATKGETDDPNQEPEPSNGGNKFSRRNRMIARINELNGQLAEPNEIDQAWLSELTEGELEAYGLVVKRSAATEAEQVPDDMQGVE